MAPNRGCRPPSGGHNRTPPYDRRSKLRKTLGLVAAGLLAVLGVALAAAPAGITYAATAIEYGLIA
jgi:hypothetical protein